MDPETGFSYIPEESEPEINIEMVMTGGVGMEATVYLVLEMTVNEDGLVRLVPQHMYASCSDGSVVHMDTTDLVLDGSKFYGELLRLVREKRAKEEAKNELLAEGEKLRGKEEEQRRRAQAEKEIAELERRARELEGKQ